MSAASPAAGHRAAERLWPAILAAAILVVVLAETRAQPATSDESSVSAAETALSEALRTADRSAARKLLSLQFTFTDENGKTIPRKEFLAELKNVAAAGPTAEVRVKVYGLVAAATGTRRPAAGGEPFFLDVWAKQKGSWRALTMQEVALGTSDRHPARSETPPDTEAKTEAKTDGKPYECKNPCDAIPYRVRSPAEQEIVTAFQEIARATLTHNSSEWGKHVADEFMLYRSGYPPVPKSEIVTTIEREKKSNLAVTVSEVATMRLAVYGDGAAMIADHVSPDNPRPPYRAASVWTRRGGQWLLAIDVETEVKQ